MHSVNPPRPEHGAVSHPSPALPPLHAAEAARLDALRETAPFARPGDPLMESLARQAAEACGVPVALVSLLEGDEERFVACVGYDIDRIARRDSLCAYAILENDVLAVPDATADPRFRDNPYVVGEPHVRFYVGAPILDANGLPLGALCVIDLLPQEATPRRLSALRRLSEVAGTVLEARRLFAQAGDSEERRARLDSLLLTLIDPRASPR